MWADAFTKLAAALSCLSSVDTLKMQKKHFEQEAPQEAPQFELEAPPLPDFHNYTVQFNRNYGIGSAEYQRRQDLYNQQVEAIKRHNQRHGRLWIAAVNKLADRTKEELAHLRGYKRQGRGGARKHGVVPTSGLIETTIATSIDWGKTLLMANNIPDQAACGSCWAVATVSMLQARFEAYTNKSRTFSAQQLVNCAPNEKDCGGTGGCDGSTVELAMEYMAAAGLKDSSSSGEPYFGEDMECQEPMPSRSEAASSLRSDTGLVGWEKLPENKIAPVMEALQRGPVAISLAATHEWNMYHRGIFDSCDKDAEVSHAVVLFGYGSEPNSGKKYWSVRNSWGKEWGENGYIRMLRQDTPALDEAYCGWDNDPGVGTACKPYPEKVYVCGMCGMLYDSVVAHFSPDAPALIATDGDGTGTFHPQNLM